MLQIETINWIPFSDVTGYEWCHMRVFSNNDPIVTIRDSLDMIFNADRL